MSFHESVSDVVLRSGTVAGVEESVISVLDSDSGDGETVVAVVIPLHSVEKRRSVLTEMSSRSSRSFRCEFKIPEGPDPLRT